jgi:hypothetical protein
MSPLPDSTPLIIWDKNLILKEQSKDREIIFIKNSVQRKAKFSSPDDPKYIIDAKGILLKTVPF